MIVELLVGTGIVAAGYAVYRKYRKKTIYDFNTEYLKRLAGVNEQKEKPLMLHEMKQDAPPAPEPYWWQKSENQKLIMSMGKLPETKDEMDPFFKENAKKIVYDENEVEWALSKEAKKQYKKLIE